MRHGETEWNVEGLLQGHSDSTLTEKGANQAKFLGEKLKNIHFDAVFSSDSIRAVKTAEIITMEKNLAVTTTKLLRERAFGKFEGKKYSVFADELKDLLKEFEALPDNRKKSYKFPEVESDEEIMGRFITFLRETAVAYQNKTVLVVTHGGVMRALLVHLGYGTYAQIQPTSVKNGSYIKLESDGIDFFIKETKGVLKSTLDKVEY